VHDVDSLSNTNDDDDDDYINSNNKFWRVYNDFSTNWTSIEEQDLLQRARIRPSIQM
jgi:G:T/U-mismatch repair DNA glycosylase